VFLTVLILLLSSISFYQFEKIANEYINTLGDSVWWNLITITTLGFVSDVEPATVEGKVISVALIFSGLVLFGTFISMVTDYFILDEEIEERLHRIETHYTVIEYKLDDIAQKIENLSSEE
jgi:voltage-gated potassium channel Kch